MDIETYITDRLDNQIDWYSIKSTKNQTIYKILKISEMILASSITILAVFINNYPWLKIIIIIAGALIIIFTGIHGIYNFQENWVEYRSISEILKHEKYMFLTKAGIYNLPDDSLVGKLLVERCESIISRENINWSEINKSQSKKTQSN
ncbi:DUF4231 domain-containing protein [Clostridium sp.]